MEVLKITTFSVKEIGRPRAAIPNLTWSRVDYKNQEDTIKIEDIGGEIFYQQVFDKSKISKAIDRDQLKIISFRKTIYFCTII